MYVPDQGNENYKMRLCDRPGFEGKTGWTATREGRRYRPSQMAQAYETPGPGADRSGQLGTVDRGSLPAKAP